MVTKQKKSTARIRDWKGLLHDKARVTKVQTFVAMLVVSTSMTFTQFGFIGVGAEGDYAGYALGLLAPLAMVALLLGKGAGALFGILSGAVLYLHARIQPLDLFERYLVSSFNSIVLYAITGFMLGLVFAIALRGEPRGVRRGVYLAISSAISSCAVSIAFFINGIITLAISALPAVEADTHTMSFSSEWVNSFSIMRGLDVQVICDFLMIFLVCLVADYIVHRRASMGNNLSVRTSFGTQLFVVAALVYCVVQAISFVAITHGTMQQAHESMMDELIYIDGRLTDELSDAQLVADALEPYTAAEGSAPDASKVPEEIADLLIKSHGIKEVLEGYDLTDGTVIIFNGEVVVSSYNPAYPVGATMGEMFDSWRTGTIEELAQTGRLQEMLYDTNPRTDEVRILEESHAQLGYMTVRKSGEYYLMMARPSSMIFNGRSATVRWVSITALVLLATIYVLAARLLGTGVIGPIDRTNESLAKITSGNLYETVDERDNREFASLSTGINETVGALRGFIDEAERRNEQDLAVAKRIQESALPSTFPPFPEIAAFDIFAAMDAAKEVGGDFYDFFLIDEHTLGFLIADVSGKGIPGALFMMAAKTEIENYLATGMEPADAIASANRRLCANNDAGMLVTVWAATLDWQTGLVTYVNAGHNFPLVRRGALAPGSGSRSAAACSWAPSRPPSIAKRRLCLSPATSLCSTPTASTRRLTRPRRSTATIGWMRSLLRTRMCIRESS